MQHKATGHKHLSRNRTAPRTAAVPFLPMPKNSVISTGATDSITVRCAVERPPHFAVASRQSHRKAWGSTIALTLLLLTPTLTQAQWTIQESHTTANLRGIAHRRQRRRLGLRHRGHRPPHRRRRLPLADLRHPAREPNTSTSAASRPSTPTPPSSCPPAKATSPASTKPPTAANPGNSSSPTPTTTASGTRFSLPTRISSRR